MCVNYSNRCDKSFENIWYINKVQEHFLVILWLMCTWLYFITSLQVDWNANKDSGISFNNIRFQMYAILKLKAIKARQICYFTYILSVFCIKISAGLSSNFIQSASSLSFYKLFKMIKVQALFREYQLNSLKYSFIMAYLKQPIVSIQIC